MVCLVSAGFFYGVIRDYLVSVRDFLLGDECIYVYSVWICLDCVWYKILVFLLGCSVF